MFFVRERKDVRRYPCCPAQVTRISMESSLLHTSEMHRETAIFGGPVPVSGTNEVPIRLKL
jgi:hypothetical protein